MTISDTSTRQRHDAQAGWQLWQAGKTAEAEAKFKLVVQLDPHNAEEWSSLGRSLSSNGKGDIAIVAFREALKIVADDPAALAGLGQALLSKGDYDEAENYLLKAAPHSPAAAFGLAQLYLLQGKFELAEKWAKKIIDAGVRDETVKAIYEAAKAKHLSNDLRARNSGQPRICRVQALKMVMEPPRRRCSKGQKRKVIQRPTNRRAAGGGQRLLKSLTWRTAR